MSFAKFPAQFGDYLLAHRVASGGMADVYCAKPIGTGDLQRLVAIKCMRPNLSEDEKFASMFIDEAKLATSLTHANIVQILDLGRVNGQLFIAMELVHGRDLGSIIKRARDREIELSLGVCAYIIAKAAEALDFAHNLTSLEGQPLDLVHSDVSPQNVLVSFDGAVKVVDFGIARAGGRGTGLEGKFAYMAPEQTRAGDVDLRVDVFALGSVLFELVTGARLFEAESQFGVLEKVRVAEIPDLERANPRIRGDAAQVLRRALAKDPEHRFRRAMELAEALSPLMIDGTTIVGARQTAELMRSLFEEEIERDAERLKRAIELSREDVGKASAVAPVAGGPEILAASIDVQSASATAQSDLDDIDVDIMPVEERRDPNEVVQPNGSPAARGEEETALDEAQQRAASPVEVLGRPIGDLLGGRSLPESTLDAGESSRDTSIQPGILGMPRDTVLENPALVGSPRDTVPENDALIELPRDTVPVNDAPVELPRGTVLENDAPVELPRDTVPENPAPVELLRDAVLPPPLGANEVRDGAGVAPPAKEAAARATPPQQTSDRAGIVAGGLVGLALVAAVLVLVVWPKVGPRLLGELSELRGVSQAPRPTAAPDGVGAGEALASAADAAPADNTGDVSSEAPSEDGVVSGELDAAEEDDAIDATGHRKFGFIKVKTPGVKAARIFVDGREVTRAARRGLRVRTGKRTITVIEQVPGGNGRTKLKNVRVGPGSTRDSPLKVVVRM